MTEENPDLFEDHQDHMMAVECAKTLLNRLSVKELRVLMAHYCGGAASEFVKLSKRDLIDEIAPEYATDQLEGY